MLQDNWFFFFLRFTFSLIFQICPDTILVTSSITLKQKRERNTGRKGNWFALFQSLLIQHLRHCTVSQNLPWDKSKPWNNKSCSYLAWSRSFTFRTTTKATGIIPKIPHSTVANQFIGLPTLLHVTNSAWQSTVGESLLVNQLWQQDGKPCGSVGQPLSLPP